MSAETTNSEALTKRTDSRPDGRYIVYYSFDEPLPEPPAPDEDDEPETAGV